MKAAPLLLWFLMAVGLAQTPATSTAGSERPRLYLHYLRPVSYRDAMFREPPGELFTLPVDVPGPLFAVTTRGDVLLGSIAAGPKFFVKLDSIYHGTTTNLVNQGLELERPTLLLYSVGFSSIYEKVVVLSTNPDSAPFLKQLDTWNKPK